MNKIILVGAIAIVAGCASTRQVDQANVKIDELESRIARMEKDLYRVDAKSAPMQTVEPKFVPAKEVEQSVIDTKIDAFLKEYVGVALSNAVEKGERTISRPSTLLSGGGVQPRRSRLGASPGETAVAPTGTTFVSSLRERREARKRELQAQQAAAEAKAAAEKAQLEQERRELQAQIDTKIDAFLKDYLGVAFGESIEKYPQVIAEYQGVAYVESTEKYPQVVAANDYLKDRIRVIPVQKKFQYFDKALGHFHDGKLYGVSFFADIENKYSIDSTNERINQTLADMAVTFGLASNAFERGDIGIRLGSDAVSSYSLSMHDGKLAPNGFRRRGADIVNDALYQKIVQEKETRERATGEILPEAQPKGLAAADRARRETGHPEQLQAIREEELKRVRESEQLSSTNSLRAKFQSEFKGVSGYEMGQKVGDDLGLGTKCVTPKKMYRYFNSCELQYVDGCLCGIVMRFESSGNYSLKSLDKEAEAVSKDLEGRFGIVFSKESRGSRFSANASESGWWFYVDSTDECNGLICLGVRDNTLRQQLLTRQSDKLEAQKEALPIFGKEVEARQRERLAQQAAAEAKAVAEKGQREQERELQRQELQALTDAIKEERAAREAREAENAAKAAQER